MSDAYVLTREPDSVSTKKLDTATVDRASGTAEAPVTDTVHRERVVMADPLIESESVRVDAGALRVSRVLTRIEKLELLSRNHKIRKLLGRRSLL